jgi:hypothetical protein
MTGRRRRQIGAAFAAIALAFGLTAVPAQATPIGLYDCPSVSYIDIGIRPLFSANCVGPLGGPTAGSVYEISTGKTYSCLELTGSLLPDGTPWLRGYGCHIRG